MDNHEISTMRRTKALNADADNAPKQKPVQQYVGVGCRLRHFGPLYFQCWKAIVGFLSCGVVMTGMFCNDQQTWNE